MVRGIERRRASGRSAGRASCHVRRGTGRGSGRRGASRCWTLGVLCLLSRLGRRYVIPGARAALHGWAARLPGPPRGGGSPLACGSRRARGRRKPRGWPTSADRWEGWRDGRPRHQPQRARGGPAPPGTAVDRRRHSRPERAGAALDSRPTRRKPGAPETLNGRKRRNPALGRATGL